MDRPGRVAHELEGLERGEPARVVGPPVSDGPWGYWRTTQSLKDPHELEEARAILGQLRGLPIEADEVVIGRWTWHWHPIPQEAIMFGHQHDWSYIDATLEGAPSRVHSPIGAICAICRQLRPEVPF